MSEDAPVNTGAARWPHPDAAFFAVQSMQTKLHRWAGEDSGRCFGDLFNLVHDPARASAKSRLAKGPMAGSVDG